MNAKFSYHYQPSSLFHSKPQRSTSWWRNRTRGWPQWVCFILWGAWNFMVIHHKVVDIFQSGPKSWNNRQAGNAITQATLQEWFYYTLRHFKIEPWYRNIFLSGVLLFLIWNTAISRLYITTTPLSWTEPLSVIFRQGGGFTGCWTAPVTKIWGQKQKNTSGWTEVS